MHAPDKEQPVTQPRSEPPAAKPTRRAIKSPLAVTLFLVLAGATLAADLWSKQAVFNTLLSEPKLQMLAATYVSTHAGQIPAEGALAAYQRRVCPGLKFTLSTNPHVAFGLPMFRWLVTVATVATIGLVAYFFAASSASAGYLHMALALVLGGALGNLYDRLFAVVCVPGFEPIHQQVRDFIDCSDLHYNYIFNMADAWLVVGVAMLMIHWWRAGRQTGKPAGAKPAC